MQQSQFRMIKSVPVWNAFAEDLTMELAAVVLIGSVVAWFVEEISSDAD